METETAIRTMERSSSLRVVSIPAKQLKDDQLHSIEIYIKEEPEVDSEYKSKSLCTNEIPRKTDTFEKEDNARNLERNGSKNDHEDIYYAGDKVEAEPRSRASPEQFAALCEFMECHGDITRPQQGLQGRIKADRLWQKLGELLNSIDGGVTKPIEKWKKVWADWKAKTKKKALVMRRGDNGGLNSRQTLTALEQRVLRIMGLSSVVSRLGTKEGGFDDQPTERISPLPQKNSVQTEFHSQNLVTEEKLSGFVASRSDEGTAASPVTTSEFRCRPPDGSPAWSVGTNVPVSTSSTSRRRRLHKAYTRRTQTPFERATSAFIDIERRRTQLDEEREANYHEREMERLRLESRRIQMEENRNAIFSRLSDILENVADILPQLRPSSLSLNENRTLNS
ncbi:unnamed protein product [Parnassius apollo]|uniref:Regulatory protein zeste n=1 Tax=Parnassius apollo TaxID=110799 RepID=A0A8S3YAH8_PARAO|nr:unnamed protein product [Parnassius apollo]